MKALVYDGGINTVGKPLERAQLARLFSRFYRIHPSRADQTGGRKPGLSIAKHIVPAHKEKIRAEQPDHSILVIW